KRPRKADYARRAAPVRSAGKRATPAVRSIRDDRSCQTRPSPSEEGSGSRTIAMSWRGLPECHRLADHDAEARVLDLERELETAVAAFGVGHRHLARREPTRQAQPPAEDLEKIVVAAEHQHAVMCADAERHAEATAEILLDTGRTGEALGGMDDLRKTVAPRV